MLRLTALPTSSRVGAAVLVLAAVLALVFAHAARAAGESITPDSNSLTIGEGAQGVYKVALAGDAPAAGSDVTVAITSDNTDVTVNPASLTFSSTNHTVGQNVVVSVSQDSDAIDERATLTHSVSGSTTYSDVTVSVSVTDDDEISITLSETALMIDEADDTDTTDVTENVATYTVTVGAAPEAEMTIAIGADPAGKVTLSSASLTFATTATYPNVQTVTVTAAEDATTHDERVTLTHTVTGGSTAYRALSGKTVSVSVTDDDEVGVTFEPTSLSLTEGGDAGTYTVVLDAEPTDDVTVTISSTNSDVTVDTDATEDGNQNTLTFLAAADDGTPSNSSTAQTVTVTAGEDADNQADSATLRHTIASDDSNYSALTPTLAVSVTDNNAGIAISKTSLTLYEGGDNPNTQAVESDANAASYTVTVQAAPPTDMTIAVDPNVTGKVTLATVPLTFAASGTYPSIQTITVTAENDATTLDETVTLTHTVTGGSAAYRAFSGRMVTVTVMDDDDAGFTFEDPAAAGTAITSVSVTEGDAAGSTYTVELANEPTGDVTVAISSGNSDVTVSPARLTFNNSASGTLGSWDDPQTVTVKAAEDANNVGESVKLTHSAASADSSYSGLAAELTVSVTDNDAGIGISPKSLTVYEGGDIAATTDVTESASATYTVTVQGTPVHDVVVTITGTGSGATLDANANAADQPVLTQTLTFTTSNFADAQTVTVTALDDADNVDASLTLAHAIASNDARYNSGDAGSVTVGVMDNEPSVTIEPSMLDAVVEGESRAFSVALDNDPGAASGVVAISSDHADVTFSTGGATPASTLSLTFTAGSAGNYGTAQMVTVHVAVDEDDVDEPATITLAVSGGVYDGLPALTLSLQIKEPAPEPVTVSGPTVTVTETQTVTRTKTVTETVEVPAAPNVIGGSTIAMATEVDGRVLITRHDGGPSLVVDIGGFIRDESFGQTYQVVRRADGNIVRQWVSPGSPLVYQVHWAVVNTSFTVPVGVVGAIPLDDQVGSPGQLVRRFDGGDDRIFSYEMGQWRHVPDIPTFQALGFFWCDVTAADSAFFDRISIGPPHPATDMPARGDYPNCSTG